MCSSFAFSPRIEKGEGPSSDTPPLRAAKDAVCKTSVRRVLVKDADQTTNEIIVRILGEQRHPVLSSENDKEALTRTTKKSTRRAFNVVILDVHIPARMHGKETLKKLLETAPLVKAVVTSGDVTDPGMATFRKFGSRTHWSNC